MAAVARRGDSVFSATGSGYKCRAPRSIKIASASTRFFADGIGIARGDVDTVSPHAKGECEPDGDLVIKASSRVFIEGHPAARIGDSAESDNRLIAGSSRVFFG